MSPLRDDADVERRLLGELARLGVGLRLDGDRLDVQAPRGVLTAALRAALARHRDGLIVLLRAGGLASAVGQVDPQPARRHEPFPLTDVQHAYWIGRQSYVELGGVATHYYTELESTGLDLARLTTSLNRVIARHDMLRAVVQPDGRQRVLPTVPAYEIACLDVRGHSPEEQAAAIEELRVRMRAQVRPADRWPLLDVRAVRLDGGRLRLHLSHDLLLVDAQSLAVVLRDWRRFYEDPDWAPVRLALSFRDCVLAGAAMESGEAGRRAEQYWLARVDELAPAPQLPLAQSPDRTGRPEFTRRRATLPAPRWEVLKNRAGEYSVTPSVALMAAFAEVLRLWSRRTAFTLNLTLFRRPAWHPQIEHVVGDFTSTNLLEIRGEPGQSLAQRATAIQHQLMSDLEHSVFSGVKVLRERARRNGSPAAAAMPVVFTSTLGLGGGDTFGFLGEQVYGISQTPQIHLDHQVFEQGGALVYHWDAVDALFPPGLLDDAFATYRDLLHRLVDDPGVWERRGAVVGLPAAQAAERQAATATDLPAATLHGLVAAQIRARPEAAAVIAADGEFSFRQLGEHAGRLAGRLRQCGIGRGDLVAVCLPRGREQVAAVLGAMAAGAAYVPVDPELPDERRRFLLGRTGARVVLTQAALRDRLAWPPGVTLVTASDPETRAAAPIPLDDGSQDDLAYVIFTSGSTGQPKGVMIEHRGAVNTVTDINRRFGIGPRDRVLALSALSFDLSVYDIFGVLAAGGTVVLPAPDAARDPAHWADLVARHGVTLWNSVPALMQMWVDGHHTRPTRVAGSSLRLALLSGDRIPVTLPDQVRALHPGIGVVSLGGATEASIWSVYHPIGEVDPQWRSIPYGQPLANQRGYVYNEWLEPCPVWTIGDLYIGGTGLARGYLGDPERTAERLVIHPVTGERLYRTGDLARYLPGGDLEFCGREDFQVKIHGHRIELGEIEACLRRQPGVAEAVVTVVADPRSDARQLVAYVAPSHQPDPTGPAEADANGLSRTGRPDWLDAAREAAEAYLREQAAQVAAATRMWAALDEAARLTMATTLARLGRFSGPEQVETAASIVAAAGLPTDRVALLEQWLAQLAEADVLTPGGRAGEYRCRHPLHAQRLQAQVDALLRSCPVDGPLAPFVEYFRTCAHRQPELLASQLNSLQLLFPNGGWDVADAIYRHNPAAAAAHLIAARALRGIVDQRAADTPLRILELGAGGGGVTTALLPVLPADRTRYHFTDVSSFFTDGARQRFAAFPFVEFERLDIEHRFAAQGHPPGTYDVVVAANVLHIATDLDRVLTEIRSALAPGGWLLLIEGTRNTAVQMVTIAYLEHFGGATDRREGGPPLLSAPRWRERLLAGGFNRTADVSSDNNGSAFADIRVIVAQTGAHPPTISPAELRRAAAGWLPEYMVPQHYVVLDRLPLNANGKVDRSALTPPWGLPDTPVERIAPRDETEERLLAIWSQALGHGDLGVEDGFVEAGGDSLLAVTILTRVRAAFALPAEADDIVMKRLLDNPTIAQLAVVVREQSGDE